MYVVCTMCKRVQTHRNSQLNHWIWLTNHLALNIIICESLQFGPTYIHHHIFNDHIVTYTPQMITYATMQWTWRKWMEHTVHTTTAKHIHWNAYIVDDHRHHALKRKIKSCMLWLYSLSNELTIGNRLESCFAQHRLEPLVFIHFGKDLA